MDPVARPSVLFVSKPMTPPFHDGSKCLVRDLCLHMPEIHAHLMSTGQGAAELAAHAKIHAVYGDAGRFAPSLTQNLRAFAWLMGSPAVDLWHTMFAPNPKASRSLALLARAKRVTVCQTIASPPRDFERPDRLLFGDIVVAQSAWTKGQFLNAYQSQGLAPPPIVEIPPPCPRVLQPGSERIAEVRRRLGVKSEVSLFSYPGDLEVSGAAEWLLDWSLGLGERLPNAKLVVAYRTKTPSSRSIAQRLSALGDPGRVIFLENAPDIVGLLAASRAVLFPVDDLYGKVDLPLVLLEALSLGTPVLALDEGPLQSLDGALRLPLEPRAWLEAVAALSSDERRAQLGSEGQVRVASRYDPRVISRAYWEVYQRLLEGKRRWGGKAHRA